MKKLFALSLCMLMIAMLLAGCASKFGEDMDIKRYPLGADEPIEISEGEKQEILDILNSGIWKNQVWDCVHNRALEIDGRTIKFSVDCGHFEDNGKTLTVKGEWLDAAKRIFGEDFGADTMPATEPQNEKYNASMDIKRYIEGEDEPSMIPSISEKRKIAEILNSGIWEDGVYDCVHANALNIDGQIIKFSASCGHFETDGKTLTVEGEWLDAAIHEFGEFFGIPDTGFCENAEEFALFVEDAIAEKFGISNFKLAKIKISVEDSPEHSSNITFISGTAGENGEKWSKSIPISYGTFLRLYSDQNPYVLFDAESGIWSEDVGVVCLIIDRCEGK